MHIDAAPNILERWLTTKKATNGSITWLNSAKAVQWSRKIAMFLVENKQVMNDTCKSRNLCMVSVGNVAHLFIA